MRLREDRLRVRPNLVRRVPVRRDSVGPNEDEIDLSPLEKQARGRVDDDCVIDPGVPELPRGEPRALKVRPRLRGVHEELPPRFLRRREGGHHRPDVHRREGPRVAMREDPHPVLDEPLPVATDRATSLDVISRVRLRGLPGGLPVVDVSEHAVDRREQVVPRWPRPPESRGGPPEVHPADLREREPVRRCGSNRGRSTDRHSLDRARDVFDIVEFQNPHRRREGPLVDHPDGVPVEPDRPQLLRGAVEHDPQARITCRGRRTSAGNSASRAGSRPSCRARGSRST